MDNPLRNAVTYGAATRIALAGHRLDHTITITVDDNGRGLPAEKNTKMLARYSREEAVPRPEVRD